MAIPAVEEILTFERSLWEKGFRCVAGIDEAGRGPLAGPVVSACVAFEPFCIIEGVYDSKALTASKRERLYSQILDKAVCYAIGVVDHQTIDRINIFQASRLSMKKAFEALSQKPDFVLIDAVRLDLPVPSQSIIKGDQKSFSIAAASIVAKVYRDRLMEGLHQEYPDYGWNQNKGYPTKAHREAIHKYGYSPYHRRTFHVGSD
jgi:ribonuclease HII